MTRLPHLLAAAALCASLGATAASAASSRPDPVNRPAPGAKAAPSITTSATGLGMAMLAAHVGSDSTLIAGAGTTGSSAVSTFPGAYEVDFNRDVSSCFYNANGYSQGFTYEVEPRAGNPNGVFIYSFTSSGTATNSEFYLTVFCNN